MINDMAAINFECRTTNSGQGLIERTASVKGKVISKKLSVTRHLLFITMLIPFV